MIEPELRSGPCAENRTLLHAVFRLLCLSVCAGNTRGAAEIFPQALSVRFSIHAEASAGPLRGIGPLWGRGWLTPGDSEPPGATRASRWFGGAPVHAHGWTPVGFRFVPTADGWATLSFEAPHPETESGKTFQGPVFLADVEAEGTTILNGRLHPHADGSLESWSWQHPGDRAPPPAPAGGDTRRHVRVPPGFRLEQRIRLTAGQTVTIRFHARAMPPPGDRPMLPRREDPSPARLALQSFRRGVNLGNYLEAPPGEDWGAAYTASDFDAIRAEGFDHVRIPVAWHHHLDSGPERRVAEDLFRRVDRLLRWAVERELAVLLNWHHYADFMAEPDQHADTLETVWKQIASRYADSPGTLAFEIMNEPHGRADTFAMNRIYARLVPAIRAQAPARTVFVGPGRYQHIEELRHLRLPPDDRLVVSVHHYEPFLFTHQGASWTLPLTATTGIRFPGPPAHPVTPRDEALRSHPWLADWVRAHNELPAELNPSSVENLRGLLRWAREWSDYHGYPVHIGEFGAVKWADPTSRIHYHREMRRLLDTWELPWTLWDWNQNFRYWDTDTQRPVEGLRHALFD